MLKKIIEYIKHPSKVIIYLAQRNIIKLSDEKYLKLQYKVIMGKKLNLGNPKTFNEKLQWLKLNDRKNIYTTMVDKYEVKEYIKNTIGEEFVIPTIGVYDNFDDIDFSNLPNQFVIKCTHDSGGVVIVYDKETFNLAETRKKISKCLKKNFFYFGREWPYKNVKPKIIIEKYMENNLNDYKLFSFNGDPKIILVCSERYSSANMCKTFFDNDWNVMNVTEGNHRIDKNIKKPINYDKMIEISKKISKNIPFVRVDFYEIKDKLYFGEVTFYPNGGLEKFKPDEWDVKLGNLIELNLKRKSE